MTAPSIASQRRSTVRAIKRLVEPHMWDSGYKIAIDPKKGLLAGSRRLKLWAPRDAAGNLTNETIPLSGYVLDGIEGITEQGPITDGFGGGLVWTGYSEFPLEDLLKLRRWSEKTFATLVQEPSP